MTRSIKYRLRALAAWVVIGGFCGGLTGYYLGRAHTEEQAEQQIAETATRAEAIIASMVTEARALLAEFNAAHLPACSPAEIELLRGKIYEARNLRDGGRIVDGQMRCSALFGEGEFPRAPIKPTIRAADGLIFYRSEYPYSIGDHSTYVLQQGNFYVVIDPNVLEQLQEFSNDVEATTIDAATGHRVRPSGLPLLDQPTVLDRNWQGRNGDTLYATRCSDEISMCSTAYESRSSILRADRKRIGMDAAVGCILGVFPVVCGALIVQFRLAVASQLLRAIRKEQVQIVYQPIVDLKTRRVVAAEALARWTDEDGAPVSPLAFVRIAEQRGFISELTEMGMRRALSDFRQVLLSDREFRINLNITAADLENDRFIVGMEEMLRAARVTADRVAFEVTEGSTARKQTIAETIHELRRRGHLIEVDDFGTGYSSLSYLKDFPVDAIKIDQSFTQTIDTSAATGEILPQILSIATALNLLVIVEGIETPRQAEYFSHYEGRILGQGWYFGHPVAADEFHRLWLYREADSAVLAE
jgi:sensor c-di-GMP phosphodiesterase-like protein